MSKRKTNSTEVVYTICPVLVASHVAVHKGWLQAELKKKGASLKYLWSLPHEKWLAHFTHARSDFFRDGGNIPAIWTRSLGQKTRLIGLTFSGDGGQILVRRNSDLHRIQDLKGRKIGLFKRLNPDRVDFWRATAERGIRLALKLNGLKTEDVKIVDLPVDGPDYPSTLPANSPAELWWSKESEITKTAGIYDTEIKALLTGKVDAIYANHGRAKKYQAGGNVKIIEDLSQYPDWTLQVANTPYTITVSDDLAREHPEIVVAYLKSVIKAGRWIKENQAEAAEIFGKIIAPWAGTSLACQIARYDFVPNLSKQNLAGIEVEKEFLLQQGYIGRDFNVREWADASFLEEALGGKSRVTPAW
jgi:ABC-type nitrate/sulfonate/bicarbonate transport system substrate-binding protein